MVKTTLKKAAAAMKNRRRGVGVGGGGGVGAAAALTKKDEDKGVEVVVELPIKSKDEITDPFDPANLKIPLVWKEELAHGKKRLMCRVPHNWQIAMDHPQRRPGETIWAKPFSGLWWMEWDTFNGTGVPKQYPDSDVESF